MNKHANKFISVDQKSKGFALRLVRLEKCEVQVLGRLIPGEVEIC